MMESRNKLLSLAIAAVLAGCGSTPEKPTNDAGVVSGKVATAQAVVAVPAVVMTEAEIAPAPVAVAPVVEKAPVAPSSVSVQAPAPVSVSTTAAPAPKTDRKIPADPNTFLVVAERKAESHPNYGHGQDAGFTVNGVQGKELVVVRGEKYKFIVDTGVQHDFYLTTTPSGWGGGTYSDGVQGQFVYQGEVSFAPSANTPDVLYYQCRNHKYMGGKIYVLNKGDDIAKVKLAQAGQVSGSAKRVKPAMAVTEGAVKQKLGYAQMVTASSSAKRVEESGNAEAIGMLNDARKQVESAKASLAGGKLEDAMNQVNEGLRLMTSASRAITTESDMAAVNHKAKYDELINSLHTYDGSYKRNVERAAKTKQPLKSKLDEAEYNRLVKEGQSLGGKGDYAAANKSLEKAQALITAVLTEMLHAQTVVYDTNFETPKEEYDYELARVENYEELVPLAIEQKQPSERTLAMIDDFVKKAAQIKSEGQAIAAKGDYKMAIMALEAATSNLQRALRLAGVN
jgi:tetratricopeptide (TPR) repeat protein